MSNQKVIMGRFGSPHGVKGYIRIQSFTQPIENILSYESWLVKKNNQWVPVHFDHAEMHHKGIVAKIKGYADRESVKALTNCEIAVERHQMPDLTEGEYYWADLAGLEVYNCEQQHLGIVEYVVATGANDVLVVKNKDKTHLIPYLIDHYILKVDIENKKITVNWDPEF